MIVLCEINYIRKLMCYIHEGY